MKAKMSKASLGRGTNSQRFFNPTVDRDYETRLRSQWIGTKPAVNKNWRNSCSDREVGEVRMEILPTRPIGFDGKIASPYSVDGAVSRSKSETNRV